MGIKCLNSGAPAAEGRNAFIFVWSSSSAAAGTNYGVAQDGALQLRNVI